MEFTIDALVRDAAARGYNIVRVACLADGDRQVSFEHRGYSGDREDRPVETIDHEAFTKLCAEMHNLAIVETDRPLPIDVLQLGNRYFELAQHAAPHEQGGHFVAGAVSVAYDLHVDSIGQESWILHLGYTSSAQLDRWVKAKLRLCEALANRIDYRKVPPERDALSELWPVIDRAIDLDDFDLEGWAASRDIPLVPPL